MKDFTAFFIGKNPSIQDILLILTGSVLAFVFVFVTALPTTNIFVAFVFASIASDLVGGMVSNRTKATSDFYREVGFSTKLLFLFLHIAYPLLLFFVTGLANGALLTYIYVTMLIAGVVVLLLKQSVPKLHSQVAMLLLGLVIVATYVFFTVPEEILWFPALYFVKLIYAYPVDHYYEKREVETAVPMEEAEQMQS